MAIPTTMMDVTSTKNMTGLASSATGLSLTRESRSTFAESADIPFTRLDPSFMSLFSIMISRPKSVEVSLEPRQDGTQRKKREECQHYEYQDASDQHNRECLAVCLETHLGAPFSSDHRACEGEKDAYRSVTTQ